MKSIEWLERASAKLGNPSDRALATRIGITSASFSQHRSGICKTLKDEHCLVIAEILEIDPAIILMDQAAERHTNTPALRKQFERLGKLAGNHGWAAVVATLWLGPYMISRIANLSWLINIAESAAFERSRKSTQPTQLQSAIG